MSPGNATFMCFGGMKGYIYSLHRSHMEMAGVGGGCAKHRITQDQALYPHSSLWFDLEQKHFSQGE